MDASTKGNGAEANPKPETRNPKPHTKPETLNQTRNPKLETLHPRPGAPNSRPETRNPKPETLKQGASTGAGARRGKTGAGALRCRAKRAQLNTFYGLSPESLGRNLALNVLNVPYSIDSDRALLEDGNWCGLALQS